MRNFENRSVMWISRHELTSEQINHLKDILDCEEVEVHQVDRTFSSAEEIVKEYKGENAIVCVLPVELLAGVVQNTPLYVKILVPKNKRQRNEQGEYYFAHAGFEEVQQCIYKAVQHNW